MGSPTQELAHMELIRRPAEGYEELSIERAIKEVGMGRFDPLAQLGMNELKKLCHGEAVKAGWYTDMKTGGKKEINFAERIALMHSEISEAFEARLSGEADDKLPHRPGTEVEFADTIIRIFDQAGADDVDIADAMLKLHNKLGPWRPVYTMDNDSWRIMMTMHKLLSDALEGDRKDTMSEMFPEHRTTTTKLAACSRLIFESGKAMGLDVAGAVIEKVRFNAIRADHKMENRQSQGGKKY